jgi:WD40-like Beta Propeller Repeat
MNITAQRGNEPARLDKRGRLRRLTWPTATFYVDKASRDVRLAVGAGGNDKLTMAKRWEAALQAARGRLLPGLEPMRAASRMSSPLIAAVAIATLVGVSACGGQRHRHVVARYLAYAKGFVGARSAIWLAHADGTHAHRLVDDGVNPAVSPDGRWVAYNGCVGARDLCLRVESTAGGRPRLLARNSSPPLGWSPKSDRIIAMRGDALAAFTLDRRVTVLVTKLAGEWSISPDGERVAYTRPRRPTTCGTELVILGTDGRHRRVIAQGRDHQPVWGPHGIAFSRYPPNCKSGLRIWRISPDGLGARPITPPFPKRLLRLEYDGFEPVAWAPGGHTLLGGIASEDCLEAARFEPDAERFQRLRGCAVALSHDGRFVLVKEGGSEQPQMILAVPFDGSRHAAVLARGDVCCPSWNR